jgi:indole-3-glycerol phosphate synthase
VVTVLNEILDGVREDLAFREAQTPLTELKSRVRQVAPALDALAALRAGDGVKVIAEVKRSSPSKGALATITDPAGWLPTTPPAGPASSVS